MAELTTPLHGSAPGTLPSVEKIAPGITCEWLHDRALLAYTVKTIARPSIDAWLSHMKQLMTDWPVDRPLLAMQDLADENIESTPYARERAQEIMKWRPELKAHVALILPRTFQGRLIQFFVEAQHDPVIRIFFSSTEGLAWLQSYLPTSQRSVR